MGRSGKNEMPLAIGCVAALVFMGLCNGNYLVLWLIPLFTIILWGGSKLSSKDTEGESSGYDSCNDDDDDDMDFDFDGD
ncbi:MAG: hypothetical protein LUD17_07745 [Bacteroidales bacterium]|nr:hypothetical protein [Bacteroidales bacterium]